MTLSHLTSSILFADTGLSVYIKNFIPTYGAHYAN